MWSILITSSTFVAAPLVPAVKNRATPTAIMRTKMLGLVMITPLLFDENLVEPRKSSALKLYQAGEPLSMRIRPAYFL
ncbi:hypothetical protein DESC_720254 [Desulfosarcina cetonica]|nr:hypothetical protein DESC_720254 [Desulfosarcina cetonica]